MDGSQRSISDMVSHKFEQLKQHANREMVKTDKVRAVLIQREEKDGSTAGQMEQVDEQFHEKDNLLDNIIEDACAGLPTRKSKERETKTEPSRTEALPKASGAPDLTKTTKTFQAQSNEASADRKELESDRDDAHHALQRPVSKATISRYRDLMKTTKLQRKVEESYERNQKIGKQNVELAELNEEFAETNSELNDGNGALLQLASRCAELCV